MTRSRKHGRQARIERAMERGQPMAPLPEPFCCSVCEQIKQQGRALTDFHDIREALTLTEEQARMYWAWVSELSDKYGAVDEILEEVSITFTFTPIGRSVVAHTQDIDVRAGAHCTLDQEW